MPLKNIFAKHRDKTTTMVLRPPWQQPRLILFVEALVEKGALVVKRDSLEMRWRVPLGA